MKYSKKSASWLLFILVLDGCFDGTFAHRFKELESLQETFESLGEFLPFFKAALLLWNGYRGLDALTNNPEPEYNPSQQMGLLLRKVDDISNDIKFYHDDISDTLSHMGKDSKLSNKMTGFIAAITEVEAVFKNLVFKTQLGDFTYEDVKQSIRLILDHDKVAVDLIKAVDTLTEFRDVSFNVFHLILDSDLKAKQLCTTKQSIPQRLYSLFLVAHDTQVKGLLMLIFAYQADKETTPQAKDKGIKVALSTYFNHTKHLVDIFGNSIAAAPRDLWRCDPPKVVEGRTYERFGRAFQKYLFNVKNAEPSGFSSEKGYCPARCAKEPQDLYEITYVQNPDLSAKDGLKKHLTTDVTQTVRAYFDFGQLQFPKLVATYSTGKEKAHLYMHEDVDTNRCHGGILRNCEPIEQAEVGVCSADSGKVERYSYMEIGDSTYGSKSLCRTKPQKIKRPVPGFFTRMITSSPCTYCMCTCDYDNNATNLTELQRLDTDRYIDLRPVTADEGYVVTGVRLRKNRETHTFHIEIKQAKLLANGRVSKAKWKDTVSYYPLERSSNSSIIRLNNDYHKVAYANTVVYLDDVKTSRDDQVVTGLRFKAHSLNRKVHLGLSVRFSNFDFESGKLSSDHEWYPKDVTSIDNRISVHVEDLDLPSRYNKQNKKITELPSYVELANSGLEYDVGQNVLPFVDIQPVETNPPVPLTGVGLYHRGVQHSGGYLGLKVIVFNMELYLPKTALLLDQQQKLMDSV